jgi:DNA-binding response OmpR family regulator
MTAERLLIVEDEVDLAMTIALRLKSAGYEVIEAATLQEGLAKVRAERPALIVLDIMLPDGSGYELLRFVRESPELTATPIIMLTGLGSTDQVENGFVHGANAYLTKPYEPARLIEAIRLLLAEARQDA